MAYNELLRQGLLQPYQAKAREVERLLRVAARDLATAERLTPEDRDWIYNIAYNAALQAARAWMLHQGYRARGPDQHRTAVRFCELTLGPEYQQQLALLGQIRRKRNRLIDELAGLAAASSRYHSLGAVVVGWSAISPGFQGGDDARQDTNS